LGPVSGRLLIGILYKMHPELAPRGRGQSHLLLGASFGCIWYKIPFKGFSTIGPGNHVYTPEALWTNLA